MKHPISLLNTLIRTVRRAPILRNQSGVAAMEFALIAPLIIGLYLGLAELASVMSVERKVSHSASVAGDLTTQVSIVGSSDAADLVSAVLHVVDLETNQNYGLRVESFQREDDGTVSSAGEIVYVTNGGSVSSFDETTLSTALLPIGGGIVVASVRYDYTPFGFERIEGENKGEGFLPDSVTLSETFMLKPRRSDVVTIGGSGAAVLNCSGTKSNVTCS